MASAERTFAWGGALLFATSLIVTAWTFATTMGLRSNLVDWSAAAFNLATLTVFALHHSVFARPAIKDSLSQIVPRRQLRTCYVYVAAMLLIAVCLLWRRVGGVVFSTNQPVLALILVAIRVAGISLIVAATRAIDALELAGIRPSRADEPPMVRGPYSLVRHPLYLGWLLTVFAERHMTGDRLLFAVATTAYLAIAIPWEERGLRQLFGEAYVEYARRVRWRIVPGIY